MDDFLNGYQGSTETQWRAIWFPPDKPQRTYTGTEAACRQRLESQAEWNPILEKRLVIVQPWEGVENPMLEGRT